VKNFEIRVTSFDERFTSFEDVGFTSATLLRRLVMDQDDEVRQYAVLSVQNSEKGYYYVDLLYYTRACNKLLQLSFSLLNLY
jgi:hypothetical protein